MHGCVVSDSFLKFALMEMLLHPGDAEWQHSPAAMYDVGSAPQVFFQVRSLGLSMHQVTLLGEILPHMLCTQSLLCSCAAQCRAQYACNTNSP